MLNKKYNSLYTTYKQLENILLEESEYRTNILIKEIDEILVKTKGSGFDKKINPTYDSEGVLHYKYNQFMFVFRAKDMLLMIFTRKDSTKINYFSNDLEQEILTAISVA